jgi:g-D-glutamyl-meso-diaminopimelate peptidase
MSSFEQLYNGLEHLEHEVIGQSAEGREVWAFHFGSGPLRVLMTGALHAREWIATELLTKLISELGTGFDYPNLALTIVPMLNPDGVLVAETQTDRVHKERQKSNANGVDLNRNFDANWNTAGTNPEPDFKDANYPGTVAFSEPETQTIRTLVEKEDPRVLIDWHFRGGLVDGSGPLGLEIAKLLASENGYKVVEEMHYPVSGSFGQWFRKISPENTAVNVEIRSGEVKEDWAENQEAIYKVLSFLDQNAEG